MTRRSGAALPLSVAPEVLPHEPDLTPEHKEAVLAALRWAWAELVRQDESVATAGDEESVSAKLQELLNAYSGHLRRAYWLQDFATVTRGESQRSVDGRIGKKPDLTFRPIAHRDVRNSSHWGWFVECKVIQGVNSVTRYRDQGVQRFSSGEYAARMPSGAMVAYVRDGSRPWPVLSKALHNRARTIGKREGQSDDSCESDHDRSQLPTPCVTVTLTHLWLQIPQPNQDLECSAGPWIDRH